MRIDGPSPIPAGLSQPGAGETKTTSAPRATLPTSEDHAATQSKPEDSTKVVAEMQPGNIVVYKFVDAASGQLIEQIPSEQMMKLSEAAELAGKSTKSE
jgi:hypothetical protein